MYWLVSYFITLFPSIFFYLSCYVIGVRLLGIEVDYRYCAQDHVDECITNERGIRDVEIEESRRQVHRIQKV